MPRAELDGATRYAELVVAGQLPAPPDLVPLVGEFMPTCQFVQWACERHLRDLETAHERGLRYSRDAAVAACAFFPNVLRHIKGEWGKGPGLPIHLELWQQFVIGSLWGWQLEDGRRRFRLAYIELPRKNTKSTMCAGAALLGTFFDDEPGAEGYCAATKRDQARIVWNDAAAMRRKSPALSSRIGHKLSALTLFSEATDSKLQPLSSDANTLDGLNPSIVVIDELHAHPNRKIVDVMDTATGARRQPLQLEITTAGSDRNSVCWEHHEHTRRVLDPGADLIDDQWFGFITTVDEGDDWREPEAWAKANPNLGVSVKVDDFASKCARAQEMPAAVNPFKQKRLNIWVNAVTKAVDMEAWDRCGEKRFERGELIGRRCFGAFDLGRVNDLSAVALVFPPDEENGDWHCLLWYWCPEEDIERRSDAHRVPYRVWERMGLLEATPGDVTDFDFIEARILELQSAYNVEEWAYDPTFAGQLVNHLVAEGLSLIEFRQGWISMTGPTGEFLRLVKGGRWRHNACPVLRWMADNLVVRSGPTDSMKPDKERSAEKIDGIVACIMGIGRAMVAAPPKPKSSGEVFWV